MGQYGNPRSRRNQFGQGRLLLHQARKGPVAGQGNAVQVEIDDKHRPLERGQGKGHHHTEDVVVQGMDG